VISMTYTLAFFAATAVAAPGSLEYSQASPSQVEIDGYLSKKASPMTGLGADLSALGQQYNIDPRLVVAISGAETTFGRHVCAANNAWNWFHHYTCPQSPFQSFQQGAGQVTKFLRLSYLNRGYTTIELIRYKYCASGCQNWIPLVTTFFNEMPVAQPVTQVTSPPASAPAAPSGNTSAATPVRMPATTPVDSSGTPPGGSSGTSTKTIAGIPAYLVFFSGAALVGLWSMRGFRR